METVISLVQATYSLGAPSLSLGWPDISLVTERRMCWFTACSSEFGEGGRYCWPGVLGATSAAAFLRKGGWAACVPDAVSCHQPAFPWKAGQTRCPCLQKEAGSRDLCEKLKRDMFMTKNTCCQRHLQSGEVLFCNFHNSKDSVLFTFNLLAIYTCL